MTRNNTLNQISDIMPTVGNAKKKYNKFKTLFMGQLIRGFEPLKVIHENSKT